MSNLSIVCWNVELYSVFDYIMMKSAYQQWIVLSLYVFNNVWLTTNSCIFIALVQYSNDDRNTNILFSSMYTFFCWDDVISLNSWLCHLLFTHITFLHRCHFIFGLAGWSRILKLGMSSMICSSSHYSFYLKYTLVTWYDTIMLWVLL